MQNFDAISIFLKYSKNKSLKKLQIKIKITSKILVRLLFFSTRVRTKNHKKKGLHVKF